MTSKLSQPGIRKLVLKPLVNYVDRCNRYKSPQWYQALHFAMVVMCHTIYCHSGKANCTALVLENPSLGQFLIGFLKNWIPFHQGYLVRKEKLVKKLKNSVLTISEEHCSLKSFNIHWLITFYMNSKKYLLLYGL